MNGESIFQELPVDGLVSGRAQVVLENPAGKLVGSGTIKLIPNARPEVEIVIEEMEVPPEYQGNLIAFLNATPPVKQGGNLVVQIKASEDERSIASFDLQTEKGVFSAKQGMLLAPVMFGFGAKETLSLILHDLTFTTESPEPARYWMIPLQGPFGDHYFKRSPLHHPVAFGEDGISVFCADGLNCWLQMFDGEKRTAHPLITYDAIAFGELRNAPKTLDETWDALPTGLMESLGFATGADITAPWIELRAADGSLVSRLVFGVGHRTSPQGFAAFAKVNEFVPNSGVSAFLPAFFSVPSPKRQSLIPVLNLLRSGAPGSFTIEESITDLVKALDNLCARYGFTTQDLLSRLDQDNREKVRDELNQIRKNFLQIAQDNRLAGRQTQGLVLDEVAGRLSAVASTSRNFGIAVNDLLNHVGLKDGEVLDQHYGILTNNRMTWSAMLSAVRGEVIHKGFLRIKDRQGLRMWFWFARHLHDLCKRIVLREINYRGQYQASTNPWQGNYGIDRIGANATLKELGFSQLPTHL